MATSTGGSSGGIGAQCALHVPCLLWLVFFGKGLLPHFFKTFILYSLYILLSSTDHTLKKKGKGTVVKV